MDSNTLVKLQYEALRAEILAIQQRNFQTMALGIVGLPAANYLAQTYDIDTLTLALPIIVIVLALRYLADNHAVVRCGEYIRTQIEPQAKDLVGWETWLETAHAHTRSPERYLAYAFYLLFFIYFAASVAMAWPTADRIFMAPFPAVIVGGYTAIGVWFAIHLVRSLRLSTGGTVAPANRQATPN